MSSARKQTTIYGLIDPRSGAVRYVGKTVMSVAGRLKQHVYFARKGERTHRAAWLRGLDANRLRPIVRIIEVVPVERDWAERERFWIARFRSENGHLLTNLTPGGEGVCIPHTPEWIEKIASAQRGKKRHPLTAEHRAKIGASLVGKRCPKTAEHREKLRLANLGRKNGPPSAETRAKISAAERGKKQPPYTPEQRVRWMASLKRGESHHQAKLTRAEVLAIRGAPAGGRALAMRYGVDYSTIKLIRAGKIWRHI